MAWITRQRFVIACLLASLTLNVAMIGYLATTGGLRRFLLRLDLVRPLQERAQFQLDDEARFRLIPSTPAEVVFAGDSLVNEGPWAELFTDIHNRGIGGDRTDGLFNRLDEILDGHPRKLVILIGANDLSVAVPIAQILRNYRAILTRVQGDSPATQVIVIGALPVNPNFAGSPIYTNNQVKALNEPLEHLVREFPNARFASLADLLTDSNGELKPEYTKDGLHLSLQGYLTIAPRMRELLDRP